MVDSHPNTNIRNKTETTKTWGYEVYWEDGRATDYPRHRTFSTLNQQTTTSEGHIWPPLTREEKKRNIGGPFETVRTYTEANPSSGESWRLRFGVKQVFKGFHWYPIDPPTLPSRPSNAFLDAKGATAIARCEPTRSIVDMSVFMGELFREGLPSLLGVQAWKGRTEKAKSAGSEYLNYQFGWVPMVSEVRKFAHAVKNAESILKQYERDAGRLVRRRYDFPIEKSVTRWQSNSYGEPLTGHAELGTNRLLSHEETQSHKIWFSGAFVYYIPKSDETYYTLRKYVDYADKLLGLELTPETMWNLAPWSWAIDWFSNTGDVLHNVSAFDPDRLVMKYGYIMSHQSAIRHTSWDAAALPNGKSSAGFYRTVRYRKLRRPATPYGFGLNLGGLTNYQWSILAALGLTKGPRLL